MSNGLAWDGGGTVGPKQVMRTNAKTARPFSARVIGRFQRTGPNSWDPYKLVDEDGRTVEVPSGLEIQVEKRGVRFRVRAYGAVYMLEWQPADGAGADGRAHFLETCVTSFQNKSGIGAAAFIAKTLDQ